MNVPIRILGIATSIFWLVLIAFAVMAAYSVKDLSFDFGEPEFDVTQDYELNLALPLFFYNRGYYSLKDFHLSTALSDVDGAEISRSETIVPIIPHGENVNIIHNITIDPLSLLEENEQYLFTDTDIRVSFTAGLNFAELFPTEISANFTFPWGAPFHSFAISEPSFEVVDFTQVTASAIMGFENHAMFDLAGTIKIELYDGEGSRLSESQTVLYVPQHSVHESEIDFSIPLTASILSAAQSGYFDVYFDLGIIQYGPLRVLYD